MSTAIPLGRPESNKLEFKSSESRPVDIAREVVALLNATGGEIWWGVKEAGGKAASEDPFLDGESRKRDLQNHLIDTIEPSPTMPGEVKLDLVPTIAPGHVMRIKVARLQRGPAAQMKDQGRRYWIRVGDRVRTMSREEIASRFGAKGHSRDEAETGLLTDRQRVQRTRRPGFWMKIQPVPELDSQTFDVNDRKLWRLLMDPAATGNRSAAWNFVLELRQPVVSSSGLRHGDGDDSYVQVKRNGAIEFRATLDRLHWKRPEPEIWPYALIEFPVSLMRLAAKLVESKGPEVTHVLVDFAFIGMRGRTLRPGSPRYPAIGTRKPEAFADDDLVPDKPFRFDRDELINAPDRCGLRLVTRIYEGFGFDADAIPPEFDQGSGTLVIPST